MKSNSCNSIQSKIQNAVNSEFDWLISEQGAFGLWIVGIWIPYNGLSTYAENKEGFFYALERLLSEGKVVFDVPGDISQYSTKTRRQGGYDDIWDESVDFMVDYIRKTFPSDANAMNDSRINDYWYSTACPHIGWVHPETGELVFS